MILQRTVRIAAALLALLVSPLVAGPVEVYREGPQFCPRDRPADAPPIGEAEAIARARALLPADACGGSRFVDGSGQYRPPLARRIGIIWFARIVSLLTRQRVTDTTSGFQALNRKGIALFAGDYPNDYPEVEATVLVFKHRLRLAEVPVTMRERETGRSSITLIRSIYYVLKVTLALFIAMVRKYAVPEEKVASS